MHYRNATRKTGTIIAVYIDEVWEPQPHSSLTWTSFQLTEGAVNAQMFYSLFLDFILLYVYNKAQSAACKALQVADSIGLIHIL